jgi:hypothetical protein
MAMTTIEAVVGKLKRLSPERQREVLTFAEFLERKGGHARPLDRGPTAFLRPLSGRLRHHRRGIVRH